MNAKEIETMVWSWLDEKRYSWQGDALIQAKTGEVLGATEIANCIKDLMPGIQDDWVSVEDEWPEYKQGNKVLGFNGEYAFECEFDDGYWTNIGGEEMTHWKPLHLPATK